ncbi:MAG: metallophosphoesterase, partial [Lachnospiraceae bacterium]|nr:metallophosphoesterase [Lachnospiraceae bacterium]
MRDIRFVHTADVHLGMSPDKGCPWENKRRQDIWDTFGRIIDLCNSEEADLLLISGDLFHR